MDETTRKGRRRFSRRHVASLEDATPEMMEAQPNTTIRLSRAQGEQLERIERLAVALASEPRPAGRT